MKNDEKKNQQSIEKLRVIFLQLGFIVALGLVLMAFEYKSYNPYDVWLEDNPDRAVEWIEIPLITEKPKLPPPPQPAFSFTAVDNSEDVEDEPVEIDAEDLWDAPMEELIVFEFVEDFVETEPEVYIVAEQMPQFPGGEAALFQYLSKQLVYPASAREAHISGTVYILFTVAADGSILNPVVGRGIGGGCDEEALRVVRAMPRWLPGKQMGRAVSVRFTLPIRFTLM